MSEFTNGLLFLKLNLETAKQITEESIGQVYDYIIHDVNNKWSVVLVENFGIDMSTPRFQKWLMEMSDEFPILFFDHAEDHGWSHRLINTSSITSSVDVRYELEWSLVYDLLEKRHPELAGDPGRLFDAEDLPPLYAQVRKSTEYDIAIANMYKDYHPQAFTVFGITTRQVKHLDDSISIEAFKASYKSMKQQVDKFREILDLEEVSWMSYRYLKNELDEDE